MSDEDRARIEQGSLVLLPESFADNWTCLLQFKGIDAQATVRLDIEQGVLHQLENNIVVEPDQEYKGQTEVWFEQKICASPDLLLQRSESISGHATDSSHTEQQTNTSDPSIEPAQSAKSNDAPVTGPSPRTISLPDSFLSTGVRFLHSEKTCKSNITRIGNGYGVLLDTWT